MYPTLKNGVIKMNYLVWKSGPVNFPNVHKVMGLRKAIAIVSKARIWQKKKKSSNFTGVSTLTQTCELIKIKVIPFGEAQLCYI